MVNKLSKSFSLSGWTSLRTNLQDKSLLTNEWTKAIQLINERINDRYFAPITLLIDNSNDRGEGFTILTVECALIEFLATLEDGRIFKINKASTDPHCYYNKSAKIYQRFLRTASIFDGYFFSTTGSKGLFSSHDFYLNVRCALIHEAQTRNNWEVKIYKNKVADRKNDKCFEVTTDGKKLIYRTALFRALKNYFAHFVGTDLTQENKRGRTLRKHLARKIDYIAEIQPDNKYWWK
jgi:hypothetical protein